MQNLVGRACSFLNGGPLEITTTVPLKNFSEFKKKFERMIPYFVKSPP